MKHVQHTPKAEFAGWAIETEELLEKLHPILLPVLTEYVKEEAARLLQVTMEDNDTRAMMPIGYAVGRSPEDGLSGPPTTDPLTIYLMTAMSSDSDQVPAFSFSLSDCIDDLISLHGADDDQHGCADEQSAPVFIAVRNALREQVNRLDTILKNSNLQGESNVV